jgi:hypothetical protein
MSAYRSSLRQSSEGCRAGRRCRPHDAWICSGAINVEPITRIMAQQAFRHLAASGVSRADD